jgi:hypothetical protein
MMQILRLGLVSAAISAALSPVAAEEEGKQFGVSVFFRAQFVPFYLMNSHIPTSWL